MSQFADCLPINALIASLEANRGENPLTPEDIELGKKLLCDRVVYDGDSARRWFIFDVDTTKDEIIRIVSMFGCNPDRTFCQHEHDCCGHWYHNKLKIQYSGGYRIAYQDSYCNV